MTRCRAMIAIGVLPLLRGAALAASVPGIDASQPIAVNADSFLADLMAETGLYTGNVIVTQGQVRLHADRVEVAAPGGKASRLEANGHVVVDSPTGQAMGDIGVYDVAAQILRLTGNVVLTKDSNVLRGNALEVSMVTGIAKLSGGPSAQNGAARTTTSGRVQGLFVPQQRAPQNPPNR